MTKEEAYNKIEKTIEEYFEFVSLVKRMHFYLKLFGILRKKKYICKRYE